MAVFWMILCCSMYISSLSSSWWLKCRVHMVRRVVSVVSAMLVVSVVGLMVLPLLWSCGVCGWVINAYNLGFSVFVCVQSVGSTLGLRLGVFGLWYPTPGISEL